MVMHRLPRLTAGIQQTRIMRHCVATKCDMSRNMVRRAGCGGGQAEPNQGPHVRNREAEGSYAADSLRRTYQTQVRPQATVRLAPLVHRAGAPSARPCGLTVPNDGAAAVAGMFTKASASVRETSVLAWRVRVNARGRVCACAQCASRCLPLLLLRVGGVPAPFETGVLTGRVLRAVLQRVVLCCAC